MMIMRANIINYRKKIMNSRETLILHTLKFKQLHTSGSNFSGDIVDKLKPIPRRLTRSRKTSVPGFLSSWPMRWSSWAE